VKVQVFNPASYALVIDSQFAMVEAHSKATVELDDEVKSLIDNGLLLQQQVAEETPTPAPAPTAAPKATESKTAGTKTMDTSAATSKSSS
jgi:hypothetical protein